MAKRTSLKYRYTAAVSVGPVTHQSAAAAIVAATHEPVVAIAGDPLASVTLAVVAAAVVLPAAAVVLPAVVAAAVVLTVQVAGAPSILPHAILAPVESWTMTVLQ